MYRTVRYCCRRRVPQYIIATISVYASIFTLLTVWRLLWYGHHTRPDIHDNGPFRPSIYKIDESYSLISKGSVSSIEQVGSSADGSDIEVTAKVAVSEAENVKVTTLTKLSTYEHVSDDEYGLMNKTEGYARILGKVSKVDPQDHRRLIPRDQGCILNGRPVIKRGLDCRKRFPEVIGIGIEKCGTTALTFFLTMHPSLVHSDPKELYYWNKANNREKGLEWYRSLMPISSRYQVTMEFTPNYIFDPDVPRKIRDAFPETKFIVMIRDPVERAVSHYLHVKYYNWTGLHRYRLREEGEPARAFLNGSFETTVIRPNGEVFKDNAVVENGLYEVHLRRWFEIFPREQFLVIDEGIFRRDPLQILRQFENFMELPKFFDSDKIYFDKRKRLFCRRATWGQRCLGDLKGRRHPKVRQEVIDKLTAYYGPHNLKLKELLNRNLTWTSEN